MRPTTPGRTRWLVGALGLLAAAALAPRTSLAACGPAHDRAALAAHHFEVLLGAGALAVPRPDAPTSLPGPCPGGVCSRGPILPIAPPSPPPPRAEHWPCMFPDRVPTIPNSRFLIVHGPPLYSHPILPPPDRPPRRIDRSPI